MNVDFAADFPSLQEMTYLNTAAACVSGSPHTEGLARYTRDARAGEKGRRTRMYAVEEECRARVARVLRAHADEVAFVGSSARALDAIIQSLPWEDGDNIVVNDHEFSTTLFAAMRLRPRGISMRLVRSPGSQMSADFIASAIDDRTRLLVISAVDYAVGERLPVGVLADVAHRHGAHVVVDAAQALGAVAIEVENADFMIAPTFKWLLGTYGLGILYARRELHSILEPTYVGWRSVKDHLGAARLERYELLPDARRFEEGTPNFPALYVLREALVLLEDIGIGAVERMTDDLASELCRRLETIGIRPLTPRRASERGGIVAFATSCSDEIGAGLDRRGIHVFAREGRIRVSPHFYNGLDDIERFVVALQDVMREERRITSE